MKRFENPPMERFKINPSFRSPKKEKKKQSSMDLSEKSLQSHCRARPMRT